MSKLYQRLLLISFICLAQGLFLGQADAAAPGPPAFTSPFPDTPTNSTTATVHFSNIAADATDVECSLNGDTYTACSNWGGTGETSGYHSMSGLLDGTQLLVVRQTNPDGQSSSAIMWTVDLTPPSTPSWVDTPADPSSDTTPSFTFAGEPGASFKCSMDNSSYASATTCTSPYTSAALSEGSHTMYVWQIDSVGNPSNDAATHTWTVDTTQPGAPTILTSPSSPSSSHTAGFTFSGDPGSTFKCSVDNSSYASATVCATPYTTASLPDGSHTFYVWQIDGAGNVGTAADSYTWSIDTSPPGSPTILTQPTDPSASASGSFTFSGDSGNTFACSLDDSSYASASVCTSPYTASSLSEGAHDFYVWQVDSAGNPSATPDSYNWTVDLTAPGSPSIDTQPSDPSSDSAPQFTFSGDPGDSFVCSVDDSSYASASDCTSPYTTDVLTHGSHTFYTWEVDGAGNHSASSASYTWSVDLQPPDLAITLTSPATTPTTSTSATITYSASDGDSGMDSTSCQLDAAAAAPCAASPVALSGLADGSHTYTITATDAVGNTSTDSVTWTVDLTAPGAPTIDDQPNDPSNNLTPDFSFSGEDNATFVCSIDDANRSSAVACESPFTLPVELTEGSHTFRVWQTDEAGNAGATPVSYTWNVDLTAPDAPTFSDVPNDPTSATDASIGFTAEDGATFQCSVDGGDYADCTSPMDFSDLAEGDHALAVKAIDAAGNKSIPAIATWTVDTTAPDAPSINSQPNDPDSNATPTFTFSGDTGATFKCSVDDSDPASATDCTSPYTTAALEEGAHTFYVWQTDAAGNSGADPASYEWNVDLTAPDAPSISGIPAHTIYRNAQFDISGDDGATFQCRLDGAVSWTACSSPMLYLNLSIGAHQVSVRQLDEAGNASTPVTYNWNIAGSEGLCPGPPTPNQAVHTYRSRKSWYFQLGDRFMASDGNKPCTYLMTVQISESVEKPSDSQAIPTVPTYAQGIVSWGSLVHRASAKTPRWVRVGSRTGKWTNWVAIHWVHAP